MHAGLFVRPAQGAILFCNLFEQEYSGGRALYDKFVVSKLKT
jgi:hypothetical protein